MKPAPNLILSVLLVWWIGTIGATIATVITLYTVSVPYNLIVIARETGVKWISILPLKHFGKCLLLTIPPAAASFVALYLVAEWPVLPKLIVVSIIYVVIIIPLLYLVFKEDMQAFLKKIFSVILKAARKTKYKHFG